MPEIFKVDNPLVGKRGFLSAETFCKGMRLN
jgi:hypothetical protein